MLGESGPSFPLTFCFLCLHSLGLPVPPQGLSLSRMAPLGLLLRLLGASCFTFCLSHQNAVSSLSQVDGSRLVPRKPPCHQGCCGRCAELLFFLQESGQCSATESLYFFPSIPESSGLCLKLMVQFLFGESMMMVMLLLFNNNNKLTMY